METFGPSPYQLSKEGIKGAEAVLDETTRLEEKEKKIVFDETTSFQKIEELITKMKEDTCTGNISVDEPLKTYEEMKKYKNSMMRKLNDLNLRRNLRIDRDNYLENIKQEYDDLRINVFKFLTSKITSKRGEFESIMDYYKDLKTNQPADWQPRECWECFKKIVAFATDPEFFSSFEIEERDPDKALVLKYNTTNLVSKLITYNRGDTNLRDELKTKVKEYDRKFKDLKNKIEENQIEENQIEQNKKPRKITTSEENRKKAEENLESVKQFFEYLDEEIKDCLNKISKWMLEDIQEMNTPQAQAERLLSGVEGITPEAMKQIIDILSSLTPQIPVGDQPASEESQLPPRPKTQILALEPQAREAADTNREPGPGGPKQPAQIFDPNQPGPGATFELPTPVAPKGPLGPPLKRWRRVSRSLPFPPKSPQDKRPEQPKPEPELELGTPVLGAEQEPALGVDPEEELGTPASADTPTPPPPPPGDSPTGRTGLIPVEPVEPDPEPEQQPPPPQQLNVGLAVPKDD